MEGVTCQKWQRVLKMDHKVNKYTMWIRMLGSPLDPTLGVPVPVRYEMKGFNTLLGSHFDHYYLVYMVSEYPHFSYVDAQNVIGPLDDGQKLVQSVFKNKEIWFHPRHWRCELLVYPHI